LINSSYQIKKRKGYGVGTNFAHITIVLKVLGGPSPPALWTTTVQLVVSPSLSVILKSEIGSTMLSIPPQVFADKNEFEKIILNSLDALRDDKLPHYLNERTTQQHLLLQTALDELETSDMFNAFPKLINWLDDNDGKGSSRFCSIRDSCEHGILDKDRALKNVNEKFPGEFEFEDATLKRNSQKNIISMKKYLPEVLNHIKRIFKNKYVK